MRHTITFLTAVLFLIIIIGLLTGCPSSSGGGGATEGIVEVDVQATGEISGRIILLNRHQQRLGDKSGVIVRTEESQALAVTNTEGEWTLRGVPGGLITIIWEKPDFGLTKQVGFPFSGGKLSNVKVFVVERPRYVVERFRDSVSGKQLFFIGSIAGEFSLPSSAVRVFFGSTPDVSSDPVTHLASMKEYVYVESSAGSSEATTQGGSLMQKAFSISMDPVIAQQNSFASGSVVYAIAYADASPSLYYRDPVTGRDVYTTLNPVPSPVVRIVMP